MKILHIMSYYQENMGYQENWLPYHQKQLGHTVEILTSNRYFLFLNYDSIMKPILGDRIKKEGIYFDKGIKVIKRKPIFEYAKKSIVIFKILDYLEKFQPDVIHLHGITNVSFFQVIKYIKNNNVKLFIDSHSDYQVTNYKSIFNKIYYKLWSIIYKFYDKYIRQYLPITKEAKVFLINEFKIKENKITINHLGVNIEKFYYDEKKDFELRKKFNCMNDIVLVNAGKQYEGKKILFIVDILINLIENYRLNNIKLFLIGNADENYKNKIINKIKGYEQYITRIPFLKNDELVSYYSMADIGIWPGVPSNTIQEAMACEVAVCLANNLTISHLINDNGCFVQNINFVVENIAKAIKNDQIQQMKKKSRMIAEKYSWENIAKKCLKIYENY